MERFKTGGGSFKELILSVVKELIDGVSVEGCENEPGPSLLDGMSTFFPKNNIVAFVLENFTETSFMTSPVFNSRSSETNQDILPNETPTEANPKRKASDGNASGIQATKRAKSQNFPNACGTSIKTTDEINLNTIQIDAAREEMELNKEEWKQRMSFLKEQRQWERKLKDQEYNYKAEIHKLEVQKKILEIKLLQKQLK